MTCDLTHAKVGDSVRIATGLTGKIFEIGRLDSSYPVRALMGDYIYAYTINGQYWLSNRDPLQNVIKLIPANSPTHLLFGAATVGSEPVPKPELTEIVLYEGEISGFNYYIDGCPAHFKATLGRRYRITRLD